MVLAAILKILALCLWNSGILLAKITSDKII